MKNKFYLVVVLLFAFQIAQAQEATYNFTQGGYSEGATVTLSFTGEDLNNDTQITSLDTEITAFSMSFSGNSVVPAFSLTTPDLSGLVYDEDGGPLGDGLLLGIEGVAASGPTFSYTAGPGPFEECGINLDCAFVSDGNSYDFSQLLLIPAGGSVTPVPTLSQWSLMLLTLLILVCLSRSQAMQALKK